jgi:CheY-like chemotaxis protein
MAEILIIDDDQQICRVLCDFLQRQGHEMSATYNGHEGVLAATAVHPDLILCDLEMPSLNGLGVVSILRQNRRLGEVPVIF